MLNEVMRHCKNFFLTGKRVTGEFHIEDGTINLPFMLKGQYFLIEKSILNDGVYQYPTNELTDETFVGTISTLAVPKDFIELCNRIEEFKKTNKDSAITSENLGEYGYTKATDKNGNVAGWKTVFKKELDGYRKI